MVCDKCAGFGRLGCWQGRLIKIYKRHYCTAVRIIHCLNIDI